MSAFAGVARSLEAVRARIAAAARRAGRDPADVHLLAVAKKHPPDAVRAAYEAGQRDFGENYVQELVEKAAALSDLSDLRWHLVGHLQRNKASAALRVVRSIQTIDSVRLAEAVGRRAASPVEVLVEVNVVGEEQKSGVAPEALPELLEAISAEPHLVLRGLMTVPPFGEDPEAARSHFRALRALRDAHGGPKRLPDLSMGMTADLEVAIEEGATWVRIGTAIFGPRPR